MSALLLALALAAPAAATDCGDSLESLAAEVVDHSREAAYLCLAGRDDAGPFLVDQITAQQGGEVDPQLTRALALHLLQRLDRPVTAEESRALSGADRRFLRDGVHARRGRQSPIPMNHKVFGKFDWYQPDPGYNPGRLSELDQANLLMIDRPPEAPEPTQAEGAAAAVAEAAAPAEAESSCGCTAATTGALWLGLLAPLGLVRRRSVPPEGPELG
jgi:hypothetical protein